MRFQTLNIIVTLTGLLLLLLSAFHFVSLFDQSEAMEKKHVIVSELTDRMFNLLILDNEIVVYDETTAPGKWREQYARIWDLINGLSFDAPELQGRIRQIKFLHNRLGNVFHELMAARKDKPLSKTNMYYQAQLSNLLSISSQLNKNALNLQNLSVTQILYIEKEIKLKIMALLIVLSAALVLNAAFWWKWENRLEKTNAKLVEKNRELDEFTYIASHDLQAPLRHLFTLSDILAEDLGADLNEDVKTDVELIKKSALKMSVLISDLLAYSRAGRKALALVDIQLDQCVSDVLSIMQDELGSKNISMQKDDLPMVKADKTQITLLFQNLIQNAVKFCNKEKPAIHITFEHKPTPVFGVKDNGIGIKPQYYQTIFHPFKKLHTDKTYPGSGIGLAICKKIIERHGGHIWVESELGRYSHFKFTIPRLS